jgi:hypothetical protein
MSESTAESKHRVVAGPRLYQRRSQFPNGVQQDSAKHNGVDNKRCSEGILRRNVRRRSRMLGLTKCILWLNLSGHGEKSVLLGKKMTLTTMIVRLGLKKESSGAKVSGEADTQPNIHTLEMNMIFIILAEFCAPKPEVVELVTGAERAVLEKPARLDEHMKPLYIRGHLDGHQWGAC